MQAGATAGFSWLRGAGRHLSKRVARGTLRVLPARLRDELGPGPSSPRAPEGCPAPGLSCSVLQEQGEEHPAGHLSPLEPFLESSGLGPWHSHCRAVKEEARKMCKRKRKSYLSLEVAIIHM